MKTLLLVATLGMSISCSAFAAFWTKLSPDERRRVYQSDPRVEEYAKRVSKEYCLFRLNDFRELKRNLLLAPKEHDGQAVVSEVPMSDGTIERFEYFKGGILSPDLEERYDLHDYRGRGLGDARHMSQATTLSQTFGAQVLGFTSKKENSGRMTVDHLSWLHFDGDYYLALIYKPSGWPGDGTDCE